MALREQIAKDVKEAMRARDDVARDTLRMLLASIKKLEIDEGRDAVDADVVAALKTASKTRQDSAQQFAAAGREDLASKERAELAVVARYLPKQMSEADTRRLVADLVEELEIRSPKDLGKLMKTLMTRHRDEVDGKLAQKIASELVPRA